MNRTAAVRRAGLAIVVAGLLGMTGVGAVGTAPAAHADDGSDLELRVTGKGVEFDGGQVSGDVWLQYTVRPPRSDHVQGFGHRVTRTEQRSGWVPFQEAAARFPGGYCVAWLQLENTQWGTWRQREPVCWLPSTTAEDDDSSEPDAGNTDSAPTQEDAEQEPPSDQSTKPPEQSASEQESESPKPEATEPGPTEAASPTPSPASSTTPSASASPTTEPTTSTRDGGDESLLFARPATDTISPDRAHPVDLTWLWVVLGGFAAAASGVVITMMRRDY